MHKTPVVFCFDDNYAECAAVAVASLIKYSSEDLEIFCIVNQISEYHKAALSRIMRSTGSRLVLMQRPLLKTEATFYRLFIPYLLQKRKVLYLDSDVIVACNIVPLLDIDLEDRWIAGCLDDFASRHTGIPKWIVHPYINAGVMLMNLKQLRKNSFIESCGEILTAVQSAAVFKDQCIINAFSKNRKQIIDNRWNVQIGVLRGNGEIDFADQLKSTSVQNSIVHFCGDVKPWMPSCEPWLAEIWNEYYRLVYNF